VLIIYKEQLLEIEIPLNLPFFTCSEIKAAVGAPLIRNGTRRLNAQPGINIIDYAPLYL
jgi:hypothetical protein